MSKPILVVGAGGFIGTHLVRALHGQGHAVLALSPRPCAALPLGVENIVARPQTPPDFQTLLERCGSVVYLASASTPGLTAGRPLYELQFNLQPLISLLEALQTAPHCDLVYLSSGGTLYGDTGATPAAETDPILPRSYYGAGKAAAEHFIHAWSGQFRNKTTIVRPSNIYGPGQSLRNGFGIIPTAFDKILTHRPLTIWGDGTSVRDYLHIEDFTRLCMQLLANPMPAGTQIINAASGQGLNVNKLLDEIELVTSHQIERRHDAQRAVDIAHIVLDNRKAKRLYDWRPQIAINEGLAKSWTWYCTQH
jgi:UDP-glucose 4-epimerase